MSSMAMSSSFQPILDTALVNYSKQTKIDLTKHPSALQLQNCRSTNDVLQLLLQRETAFRDYREKHRKLIECFRPIVQVVHTFSNVLGEVAGLVPLQPSKAIFVGIDVLISAAIGVSESYDALNDIFERVASFLTRFHIYTEKIPLSPMMSDIMVKVMTEVLNVLALATKHLRQGRFKKFIHKLLGERDIEGVLQRLDQLTQEEALMTGAHTLEVVHGLSDDLKVVRNDGKISTHGIHQALDGIKQMRWNQFRIHIRSWLSPPDPSINHNIACRDHLEGTASWFTEGEMYKEWTAMGSLFWIHGKPGSGKSILCSSIIQQVARIQDAGLASMAYFYCDFRDSKKQEVTGLLVSLVVQLSAKSDACYDILSSLHSECDGGSLQPDDDSLLDCLVTMLKTKGQPTTYIIIDGIDECPNNSGVKSHRERVLQLVKKLVDLHLPNVRICVTSRPEADIQGALSSSSSHTISLHGEVGQMKDIADYVKSIVHSDWNMQKWREEDKEMVISTLTQKADGMFRWVTCQLETLRRGLPSSIRRALDNLPESLDETYDRILKGIAQEKWEYAQRLFQCVAESIRPLRVEELADILAVGFEGGSLPQYHVKWRPENSEEEVLSVCSSLISIVDTDGSRVVRFAHFSVKEYLTSERLANAGNGLSQYHILPHLSHTILAKASMSILLALDDQVNQDSMKSSPFAIYAARYWVNHAQFDDVFSRIRDAMGLLFDPDKPHFAIWVWIYDLDYPFRKNMFTARPSPPEATPLYYATLCGIRDLVEHMIVTRPLDVNARSGFHCTPLHAAVVKGNPDIVTLLLEHGADVAAWNGDQRDPLNEASLRGRPGMVKLLLDHHADVNSRNVRERTALFLASQAGELEAARILFQHGAAVDSRDKDGSTALMAASQNGHLYVVHWLLQNGATVNAFNKGGWTPSMLASRHGHLDLVHLLLQNGANVNFRGDNGLTSLMLASENGHLDVVRLLLQNGAAIEACHNNGTPSNDSNHNDPDKQNFYTSLHLASRNGHLLVVELLIQHGADVDTRNQSQETPLHLASGHGQLKTAHLLLASGSHVNSRDNEDSTPLHKAAESGHLDVVTLLLESGADINARNTNDAIPLDLASHYGRSDVARLLAERMGVMNSQVLTDVTQSHTAPQDSLPRVSQPSSGHESTTLHAASEAGDVETVRSLLDGGADVNQRDEYYTTPVHRASLSGRYEVVKLLIEYYGADVNSQARNGWAPLQSASFNGHLNIVQLLLDHGADVNATTRDHETALHLASRYGYPAIAKVLLRRGADVDVRNEEGWTPFQLASRRGQQNIVRLLSEYDVHGM